MGITAIAGAVAVAILVTVLVLPLAVIMHYMTKWKSTKGLSDEEQQTLEDLWRAAERMNARIDTLETILDEQSPNWKRSP